MSKFITNIQLENAGKDDYTRLTQELEKGFFKVEKNGGRSSAFIVKNCILSKTANLTLQEINNEISKAAAKTGKKYSYYTFKDKQNITN